MGQFARRHLPPRTPKWFLNKYCLETVPRRAASTKADRLKQFVAVKVRRRRRLTSKAFTHETRAFISLSLSQLCHKFISRWSSFNLESSRWPSFWPHTRGGAGHPPPPPQHQKATLILLLDHKSYGAFAAFAPVHHLLLAPIVLMYSEKREILRSKDAICFDG